MTKLVIVGEAYGAEEAKQCVPFVGASGYELTRMLEEAGIHRADCHLTNVFNQWPRAPGVDKYDYIQRDMSEVAGFCGPKAEGIPGYPALLKSKYVRKEFAAELERLANELIEVDPNLIIALGNTPLWALCGRSQISKVRGTTCVSTHTVEGFKVLPTYHPAYVLRSWDVRATAVIDLMKAAREQEYPEIRRPQRQVWIEPTIEDLYTYDERYLSCCEVLSVDIETAGNQVTCIGFAPSPSHAIVIPFIKSGGRKRHYWPDLDSERAAWRFVQTVLLRHTPPKVFQNGLYDIAFLWRAYGLKVYGAVHDTMLLHHALQPESLKALGFMGSIYTEEGAWKQMNKHEKTIKRDA